jgi:hypothetical protein
MKTLPMVVALFWLTAAAFAQAPTENKSQDISGMYSFLREGEYLQLTVDAEGKVTGVVSRFGDLNSDRGAFLDQFIDKGTLKGGKLTFVTRPLHGVWFQFKGTVARGKGKTPNEEAYYVLKGTLTQYLSDENKNTSAREREVEFKSFPHDLSNPPPRKRD